MKKGRFDVLKDDPIDPIDFMAGDTAVEKLWSLLMCLCVSL
jgi:hypothetical protein